MKGTQKQLELDALDQAYKEAIANLFTVLADPSGDIDRFDAGLQLIRRAYEQAKWSIDRKEANE